MLPKTPSDWGEVHRLSKPNISQEVWSRLPDRWCWHQRGSRVGMCRFSGFMTASRPFNQIFHAKLFGMIYLGTKQGWLERKQLKLAAKKVLNVKDTGADKKQTTKESKQQVSKLFGYGNARQLVTISMLEPETYFHQCMIQVRSAALVTWHQHQNKTIRSFEQAGPWIRSRAQSCFLLPVCKIFAVF